MKQIYFHQHPAHIHSLYKSLFEHPPEGYSFIYTQRPEGMSALNKNSAFWSFNVKVLKHLVNTVLIKDQLFRFKKVDADLIYSAGYVVRKKQPWVLDFEYASSITGYDNKTFLRKKSTIRTLLSSKSCKAILPWNEWAKETLLRTIDTPEIRSKLHVVPVAIVPPPLREKIPHEKFTLLFVGSANLPKDFYHKGGKAAFLVYKELKKKHDVRLIVRCAIPPELQEWVAEFRHDPDVEIIDRLLSKDEFEEVFARSDVLISPTITTPMLIYLDCMGRKLPVVTTDAWANAEIVTHGKTGIVVAKPAIPYYEQDMLPIPMWHWKESKTFDEDAAFIMRFAHGVEQMMDKKRLKEFGEAGRREVVDGKFSIKRRNEVLQKIFDDATQ